MSAAAPAAVSSAPSATEPAMGSSLPVCARTAVGVEAGTGVGRGVGVGVGVGSGTGSGVTAMSGRTPPLPSASVLRTLTVEATGPEDVHDQLSSASTVAVQTVAPP